jgi:exonuclease SbcC
VQKHSHLIFDFVNGINIIYGATDVGKSCIIRAIRWLFFNDVNSDVLRKEGTKKTSVKAILDNDAVVERIRTETINRYCLTVGKETKEFDSIGKEIPEEIKKIIQVRPIEVDKESLILNVSKQISMPFLMDKPGSFRMKLFNLLTGNDIIDKVMQDLNKDILQIGREEKSEVIHLEEFKKDLETINKEKQFFHNLSCVFSTEFEFLKKVGVRYDLLNNLSNSLSNSQLELEKIIREICYVDIPKKEEIQLLKQKIDRFEKMSISHKNLIVIMTDLELTKKRLNELIIPQIDTKSLDKKIDKLNNLKELHKKLEVTEIDLELTKEKLNPISEQIKTKELEYKQILKELKICPLCKQEIKKE